MKHIGMPGPGGSLGMCAYCGKPFLSEIFGIGKVKQFTLDAAEGQVFHAHEKCLQQIQTTKEYKDLPDGSPIKSAWLKHEDETEETK